MILFIIKDIINVMTWPLSLNVRVFSLKWLNGQEYMNAWENSHTYTINRFTDMKQKIKSKNPKSFQKGKKGISYEEIRSRLTMTSFQQHCKWRGNSAVFSVTRDTEWIPLNCEGGWKASRSSPVLSSLKNLLKDDDQQNSKGIQEVDKSIRNSDERSNKY